MKLTVIGGGGVRSMFLAKSIAQKAAELHITELVFMDNDGEKLRIYGGLAAHVSRMLNPELKFRLTTDAVDAVKDADYIITTIRVGGDHMRVREERIALANGVLGQETTGAAGLSFAMRSVLGAATAGSSTFFPGSGSLRSTGRRTGSFTGCCATALASCSTGVAWARSEAGF